MYVTSLGHEVMIQSSPRHEYLCQGAYRDIIPCPPGPWTIKRNKDVKISVQRFNKSAPLFSKKNDSFFLCIRDPILTMQ